MLDFLAMFASVLITLIIVAGFVAVGAVLIFELATMLAFWRKKALRTPHRNASGTP